MKSKKYEFLAWFLIFPFLFFLSISMFLDALKTLKEFELTRGEVSFCKVSKTESLVLICGKRLIIRNKILLIGIDGNVFKYYKVNRNYKTIKDKILKKGKVTIYHNNQLDTEGNINAVQIQNGNEVLYSIKESRNAKLRTSLLLLISSIFFFYFGYRNFKQFLVKSKEERRLIKIKDSFGKTI